MLSMAIRNNLILQVLFSSIDSEIYPVCLLRHLVCHTVTMLYLDMASGYINLSFQMISVLEGSRGS